MGRNIASGAYNIQKMLKEFKNSYDKLE